jgi:glucokinase
MRILAGDIGGTKTLLQVAEVHSGAVQTLHERRYASADYADLAPMVREFLSRAPAQAVEAACFAVAGPVVGTRARVTNLPWELEAGALAEELALPRVAMINDFEAVGHGLAALGPEDLLVLQTGQEVARAPRVLLGAGTGLGQAVLFWCEGGYRVVATEGGHVDFAAVDELQLDLLRFLIRRHGRVSYERVLSGSGLVAVYEFLRERGEQAESAALRGAMAEQDPAAAISQAAAGDALAGRALDLFVRIYGQQAGNLALGVLADGGIYIAGGIAPRMLDRLRDGPFLEGLHHKGRMAALVKRMPVKVVRNPGVGALGAALVAARL